MFEQLLILLITFMFPPLLLLILLVLSLAIFGKSLGIRRAMVKALLRVFEWGRRELHRADERIRAERERLLTETSDTDTSIRTSSTSERCIIKRDATERILTKLQPSEQPQYGRVWTFADDSLDFVKAGVEAIIEDDVTNRFLTEDLVSWNLLTRTGIKYEHVRTLIQDRYDGKEFQLEWSCFCWRLGALWLAGLLIRYLLLFPIRCILLAIGLTFLVVTTAVIGYVPNGSMKEWLNWHANIISNRICSRSLSAIVTFHNVENMAQNGGICVANHTSPIDVMLLACDNCYALIGQRQGGLLGVIQRALNRASNHIWFERSEANDRLAVARRIKSHVQDPHNLPILIFPEGTCINNTSVMQFKKGSFEVGAPIYPVAIKYDPRFGDPFWNSSEQSWGEYIFMMMTSWAIVADVWYLPVVQKQAGEDGIGFAARVKRLIAERGGLVDLEWDGQLKRQKVPEKLRLKQQKLYSQRLSRAKSSTITQPSPSFYSSLNSSFKLDSSNEVFENGSVIETLLTADENDNDGHDKHE